MNESDAEHLEIYLEDTEHQIHALGEALTSWQQNPSGEAWRMESLRLLHAMEGAAGAMKFDQVRSLTQHLDRQLNRACSSGRQINPAAVNRLLRGVEFLRDCNDRLRAGQSLDGSAELLDKLQAALDGQE